MPQSNLIFIICCDEMGKLWDALGANKAGMYRPRIVPAACQGRASWTDRNLGSLPNTLEAESPDLAGRLPVCGPACAIA